MNIPLASKLRPKDLSEFIGQSHLVAPGKPLWQAMHKGQLHSMILWGPPGTGKTTLARMLAESTNASFQSLSAVMVGLKEIREAIHKAEKQRDTLQKSTVLFIDEVHRFNKIQQDAFLPFVEEGVITFIGATTENPSFELNNALLSRARVYILNPLQPDEILKILERALTVLATEQSMEFDISDGLLKKLVDHADGDARQALNLLDLMVKQASHIENKAAKKTAQNNIPREDQEIPQNRVRIDEKLAEKVLTGTLRRFDKGGDLFYDQISALHKAVRGSSPDGALYWFARMLDGGCDPLYVARRVVRMATEDVGLADPRALQVALSAWDTYLRLGSPEGELAIAEAIVYMAVAPKSNAVYVAYKEAMADAKKEGTLPVPLHIRNAPTGLMKTLGHGKGYRYDHDEANAFAAGQTYFPNGKGETIYYRPVPRGLEIKIKEKLDKLREEIKSDLSDVPAEHG